jgi:hypothetical protein
MRDTVRGTHWTGCSAGCSPTTSSQCRPSAKEWKRFGYGRTQVRSDVGDEALLIGLDHVQLQRDQEELVNIDAARERMRAGTYGT